MDTFVLLNSSPIEKYPDWIRNYRIKKIVFLFLVYFYNIP
ncbi:hypothetical protein HMPREF1551_00170 [Capnocytophaga sp. oral taxon 863 str. F0517]|nr:hypothetical protein HMPREF1551_00170 [Capnocytophaga sp. oral taxon 863 str. F0517]